VETPTVSIIMLVFKSWPLRFTQVRLFSAENETVKMRWVWCHRAKLTLHPNKSWSAHDNKARWGASLHRRWWEY